MSFRDASLFSMIASLERQHRERVPRIKRYPTKVLPIAALYGGNASGKTNMFQALSFSRNMILQGVRPDRKIPVKPFQLDSQSRIQPSRFKFEILVNESIYEYEFAVTREKVLQERLVSISGSSEKVLYDRFRYPGKFHSSLKDQQFLQFVFQGTRPNELLLTNAISQNVDVLRPVYDWFENSLFLIGPDDRFTGVEHLLDDGHPLHTKMSDILGQLDTGITRLGGKEVNWEDMPFSKSLVDPLKERLKEGESMLISPGSGVVVTLKNGELVATKLKTVHKRDDGTEAEFDIEQEADGSKRVIELLPAFLSLSVEESERVFVIDEIDRSLHSMLTQALVRSYLATCSEHSRSQLLLTTHDLLLMDQKLLRRDEMWLASRDSGGVSHLKSLGNFKDTRYDKDVRRAILRDGWEAFPKFYWKEKI